ncbi:LytTR family transcriptional regulator [Lentzea guizhouensis]|uniref:LytTR family transcriptional regulator n=1 Tax=Lentzea guizhouensis TaxID=1586287 RepID=A0A1B2HAU2_9PSEU|nr:LCP family protein [Lentzea guizhouensis]ANZ34833.1 LytTR family transcriptional regulator [Lentzea guizhouensis]
MSAGYHQGYQQQRRPMPPQRPRKKKRPGRTILVVLLVLLLAAVGFFFYVDSTLKRIDALPDYEGRPAETPGTTWLLVGSDARDGLSQEQKDTLATGDAAGRRTDTIMMLHLPDNSGAKPTLLSLPRDSYVPIPDNGRNKINAAFAFGGPQLLVRTVEGATGVRIDHYMEIGFGGFSDMVDAVGGVDICIDEPIKDPLAGIDLPAGCQELDGPQALGFVRTRAFATADLQRVQNQRKFLSALFEKVQSPATLVNPFRVVPLMNAASGAVSVNENDHVWHLASVALNMGDAQSGTVPIAGTPTVPGAGSVVQWNKEKASQLFDLISKDQPVPADLIAAPR